MRLENQDPHYRRELAAADRDTVRSLAEECRTLLYNKILKDNVPRKVWKQAQWDRPFEGPIQGILPGKPHTMDASLGITAAHRTSLSLLLHGLRESFREVDFSRKIPKLQQAMNSCMGRLVTFNTLVLQ